MYFFVYSKKAAAQGVAPHSGFLETDPRLRNEVEQ
jgi:hypothetical protein